jgi:hypothetical protein
MPTWREGYTVRHCWWRYGKRMNRVLMFSNWIYISYYLMAENQPRIKRTVLFVNLSSSLPCRNPGSTESTLHRLAIHPYLGLRTDTPCKLKVKRKTILNILDPWLSHQRNMLNPDCRFCIILGQKRNMHTFLLV